MLQSEVIPVLCRFVGGYACRGGTLHLHLEKGLQRWLCWAMNCLLALKNQVMILVRSHGFAYLVIILVFPSGTRPEPS